MKIPAYSSLASTHSAIDKALRVESSVIATLVDREATINAAMQPGIDAIEDMTRQNLKVNQAIDAAMVKAATIGLEVRRKCRKYAF